MIGKYIRVHRMIDPYSLNSGYSVNVTGRGIFLSDEEMDELYEYLKSGREEEE